MSRCTRPVSRSSSTGPASPATTAPATTACGTCRSCRWSRACGSPRRATRPRCAPSCARRSRCADAPTVVRFPKGAVADDLPAVDRVGGLDVLAATGDEDVLIVSVGAMAHCCVEVAERLARPGHRRHRGRPALGEARRPGARPVAGRHRLVVTVEDNGRVGGVGSVVTQALRDARVERRCSTSASRPSSSTTPSGPRCSWSSGSPPRTSPARWSRRWRACDRGPRRPRPT